MAARLAGPGRMVTVGGVKAPAFFVFRTPPLQYDRYDVEQQKQVLRTAYAGGGRRIPELIDRLDDAPSVYVGAISRPGTFLAPATRRGIRGRNLVPRTAAAMRMMFWLTDRFATDVELRDYPALAAAGAGAP